MLDATISAPLSRIAKLTMFVAAMVPLIWLTGVFSFAIRASWHLGYWPTPYNPDPKALSFEAHYVVIFLGGYLVTASLAILPTLRLCSINLVNQRHWLQAKYTYILGWVLIFVFFFVPRFNFVAWFLD